MSSPISAAEVLPAAQFACALWESCKAATSEYQQVGKDAFAMRIILELVHIECEDPNSVINLMDNKP